LNYIKEAEKYLKYYYDLNESIKRMTRERAILLHDSWPEDIKGIDYTKPKIDENFHQDEAYDILYKIKVLTENIEITQEKLKEIDIILDDISIDDGCELYGPVLKMWYVDKLPKELIAEKVKYSSRQSIYDIKNKAIRKFAIRLFGLEALKMM